MKKLKDILFGKHGTYVQNNPDGTSLHSTYEHGSLFKTVEYSPRGIILMASTWRNGLLHGEKIRNDDEGTLQERSTYNFGDLHGEYYLENSTLGTMKGDYFENKRNGIWEQWNMAGMYVFRGYYVDGYLISVQYMHESIKAHTLEDSISYSSKTATFADTSPFLKSQVNIDRNVCCPICLEPIGASTLLAQIHIPSCGHLHHVSCVAKVDKCTLCENYNYKK